MIEKVVGFHHEGFVLFLSRAQPPASFEVVGSSHLVRHDEVDVALYGG